MDPKWWYRGALALIIVAFVIIVTRMASLAFKPEAARIDRAESAATMVPATRPGAAPPDGAPAQPDDEQAGANAERARTPAPRN